jgi:predicted thioesterase
MEIIIEKGAKAHKEQRVEMKDTAKMYGSGMVEVFATPAMIALMENVAYTSVSRFLPEGFTTVGIQLNVEHSKATPIGAKVWCESVLEKQEGRKLFFSLIAFDETGVIGKGTHERFIVEVEKFIGKLLKR